MFVSVVKLFQRFSQGILEISLQSIKRKKAEVQAVSDSKCGHATF
jgi:hypothetical protein